MKNANRIAIYICGIFLLALGGVLAIKSNLGASPVSSLPLSISRESGSNIIHYLCRNTNTNIKKGF